MSDDERQENEGWSPADLPDFTGPQAAATVNAASPVAASSGVPATVLSAAHESAAPAAPPVPSLPDPDANLPAGLPPVPQTSDPQAVAGATPMISATDTLNLRGLRARKARLGREIGHGGHALLGMLSATLGAVGIMLYFLGISRLSYFWLAGAIACYMPAAWYRYELEKLPANGMSLTGRMSGEVLAILSPRRRLNPQALWKQLTKHWQVAFLSNHLLLTNQLVEPMLIESEAFLPAVWMEAERYRQKSGNGLIEPGYIAAALLSTSDQFKQYLSEDKLSPADIDTMVDWLDRVLEIQRAERPYFGGIGRDWANGFTPRLNQFGHNLSLTIEASGGHYGYLMNSRGVQAIKAAFSQGASTVALVGEPGVGKTSHVESLAQLLLQERSDRNLEHRQIVALNPSTILAAAKQPGELEQIVLGLLAETAHAGHIILFLDDAQLFFTNGHGAFDMTGILLPVLQSRSVQMVMAMTPHDYQQLKSNNATFANLMTPVILSEPSEHDVMRVLEDTALGLEHRHKVLISYDALREAYRLSGRYMSDQAYPGKSISLLEQSLSHAVQRIVTPVSVQKAIEQSSGVKVGSAAPAEATALLNLEDQIHERMIDQSQAVKVVAAALRRSRAGVANPRRPIGSFLFLGPTGVGKTELAKAVAATYFNAEKNMIRLDMSEYQRPEDVQRLLSNGASETGSLIMSVRQQPFSVVLFDEIEKAHPNILNLFLQMLDEGNLTDTGGRPVSFKDCVIIATSNAGANTIRDHVAKGEAIESFQESLTDELINSGQFKPELLNRFDEIVIFKPLGPEELKQVVRLMLKDINKTLATQNISVELTDAAIAKVVSVGYDPRLGARPMRRALQRAVEDSIAGRILRGETRPGDHVTLDEQDLA